tara:strand:- start:3053 stop:3619 length:567 start_codon:yes stop_codon:yes gene_type:complete
MTVEPDPTGSTTAPAYADPVRRRHIRRVKLALFLSSMTACLGVSLIGGISLGLAHGLFSGLGLGRVQPFDSSLQSGFMTGLQLAAMNFFLFLITVPAAWIALGLSIGRMPHRGIAARTPYIRWAAIWGAILVGGTTMTFGLFESLPTGLGALVSGSSVGAIAGVGCGLLFYAIVRPAEQLRDVDVSVF